MRSRTLGPRFRREGQLSPPASLSEPAKPDQAEPPPKRGGSVPDVAGGDNPQPGDNTPSLSTDASMGMAFHLEASKSVGQDAQPEPADAGGAKRASPSQGARMMGTAMGRREIPLLPLPMSYRAATILWMGAEPVGAVDPIHLTMTNIMRPLKVQTLASLCITCSGEQVIHRRRGLA